ncbi:uncharacterized protein BCR38DRAFT_478524 [Pseudomassariella vexata]|uniref:Uncharacterized protein n=1 Tax=Pseudomassariella vexata TaxID=1141098 RepID=A0A1Y2DCF3_9PEZI|nr:uncharacterized protein BCR38DRAFT_478524 [Pseudomassariella vexata]ORY56877.1 hypothetical protein BCR38DRAFT_478524 [Pseudomassariella vexata]
MRIGYTTPLNITSQQHQVSSLAFNIITTHYHQSKKPPVAINTITSEAMHFTQKANFAVLAAAITAFAAPTEPKTITQAVGSTTATQWKTITRARMAATQADVTKPQTCLSFASSTCTEHDHPMPLAAPRTPETTTVTRDSAYTMQDVTPTDTASTAWNTWTTSDGQTWSMTSCTNSVQPTRTTNADGGIHTTTTYLITTKTTPTATATSTPAKPHGIDHLDGLCNDAGGACVSKWKDMSLSFFCTSGSHCSAPNSPCTIDGNGDGEVQTEVHCT